MALDTRLREYDEGGVVIPDLIRDPERQTRLVPVALDTRLREYDEGGVVIPDLILDPGRQA